MRQLKSRHVAAVFKLDQLAMHLPDHGTDKQPYPRGRKGHLPRDCRLAGSASRAMEDLW
jgi:hypothetical protein